MSIWRLIISSLRYHGRSSLAVAAGVACATAVLTGALLVGNSVRGSLKDLVTNRLGQIDQMLITDRFFRTQLVEEIAAEPDFSQEYEAVVPAILALGTVERRDTGGSDETVTKEQRSGLAGNVTLVGHDANFLKLGQGGPTESPAADQLVINERLADEIGAAVGDEVLLRLGRESEIPADSPLGRKTETTRSRTLTVSEIVPTEGLGRFGLSPTQQLPLVAFASLETLQDMLEQPERVNALLIAGKSVDESSSAAAQERLAKHFRPQLTDYGLQVNHVVRGKSADSEAAIDYYNLTCDRMLLPEAILSAATEAWQNETIQPAMTYLANEIRAEDAAKADDAASNAKKSESAKAIPYSIVTAIDSDKSIGPLVDAQGQPVPSLADDEIVLNSWAAEDLGTGGTPIAIGSQITITYFQPDTTHGEVEESTTTFRLKAIVPLAKKDEPPLPANDPNLTPELPGVTDQASIDDWNPPFPFDAERIRTKDEDYWDDHRTTPKAFISLAAGKKLFGSRFGDTTSLRVRPSETTSVEKLSESLLAAIDPEELGFTLRPVKQAGLDAARGTTPFDGLFLGFSMFLIVAALMLVALLFRLGVEQRAREIGLLFGVGFTQKKATRLLLAEGLIVAIAGAAIGIELGIGYAWLMLYGLRTWWVDAVSTPFLTLHISAASLAMGYLISVVVCGLTIFISLRKLGRASIRNLLAGKLTTAIAGSGRRPGIVWRIIRLILLVTAVIGAVALVAAAGNLDGEAQAGAFFGAGALALTAMLMLVRILLTRSGKRGHSTGVSSWPILQLATRAASRNPLRSTLTVGLVASASFLIVAISAFQLEVSTRGSGGFDILATSSAAIYHDLGDDDGRFEIGIGNKANKLLADTVVRSLRVETGDDASCLNLYQSTRPQVLGVPANMAPVSRANDDSFEWGAVLDDDVESPWQLLGKPLPDDEQGRPVVPMILDQNTAMYSLHLGGVGSRFEMEDEQGHAVMFEIVGLIKNSVFQGSLLIGESTFKRLYPSASGYRMFLFRSPPEEDSQAMRGVLEKELRDFGFDATLASDRLQDLMAVQNTYLSTFQSLGGLGLLLGTFGLAVVQLRSVLERRGELALMRATGFRARRLGSIVLAESLALLLLGLAVGVVAALVVVLPHWIAGGAAVPWQQLTATLGLVLVAGMLAASWSVRATLRAPLLPALRGD